MPFFCVRKTKTDCWVLPEHRLRRRRYLSLSSRLTYGSDRSRRAASLLSPRDTSTVTRKLFKLCRCTGCGASRSPLAASSLPTTSCASCAGSQDRAGRIASRSRAFQRRRRRRRAGSWPVAAGWGCLTTPWPQPSRRVFSTAAYGHFPLFSFDVALQVPAAGSLQCFF